MGKVSFAASEFSESSFWEKLSKYAKAAGREVVEAALKLFYSAKAPETPAWAKTVIYSVACLFYRPSGCYSRLYSGRGLWG